MITIQKLHKEYNNKIVLQNVSFKAKKGEITGLIGPNGSGKSTLIRILLGLENSQMGMALIDGKKYSQLGDNPFCIVGSFLDSCQPYPTRTGFQHLRWIGFACGVDRNRCNECLELVGLSEAKNKKVKDYSLGMKQRLGLATALLANPDILILDEPTAGLDPKERVRFRNLISTLAENRIVILSTHIVSDVEYIAKEILIMKNGELLRQGSPETILKSIHSFVWECDVPRQEMEAILHDYILFEIQGWRAIIKI